MKCPDCKGSVSTRNLILEHHCPSCGAYIVRMPTKVVLRETAIDFAQDRGYIFWMIIYLFLIVLIGLFEQVMHEGMIFTWIGKSRWTFLFTAFVTGSMIDYIIKANVEVTAVRNKFIFKPPLILRRFRFYTNFGLIIGLAFAGWVYWNYPSYITVLPIMTFIPTFIICLFWAILGLFLSEKDLEDKRIRYWAEEMRISRIWRLHRVGLIYIGGFTISGIIYYKLIQISGLWWFITQSRVYYDLTRFFREYFAWTEKFIG